MNIPESKTVLRKETRTRINALPPDQRAALSGRACALLQRQTVWEQTKLIFFYAPLPDEVNIWPLIGDALAAGKTVALPRFDESTQRYVACEIQDIAKDLREGQFGTMCRLSLTSKRSRTICASTAGSCRVFVRGARRRNT